MKLQTNELDICGGCLVDITAESWPLVIDLINLVEVAEASSLITPSVTRQLPVQTYQPNSSVHRATVKSSARKPVIYLYSPVDIDASVKLSLSPEWRFSAIYPVVTPKQNGEHIDWNVRTHQDGNLTEKNTGLEVSCLFWEAEYVFLEINNLLIALF